MTSKPSSKNRLPDPDPSINKAQLGPTLSSLTNLEAAVEKKHTVMSRAVLLLFVVKAVRFGPNA